MENSSSHSSPMETSNFAHVIFQNVGKSFLPNAALECHYTVTPFIVPHPKDWVGIFKVGWSTARDYYTFLWSPLPENYEEGTTVNRTVVFQGYYVPKDDGEFYQFCYVTHKGDIRGASTPFQFRADAPSEDDLLTVEDECNSDILVVTTKASLLEQKVEEAQKEREELLKAMDLLQTEKEQLQEERECLQRECEEERQACMELRSKNQELQKSSEVLQEEKEEVKRRQEEAMGRIHQLEEDLIGVTQRAVQKETELDGLRDRLKKLTVEKEMLESQLKNERDERELYKVHLKTTELENAKLEAQLHTLRSADASKEAAMALCQEEVGRLKACLAQKEQQHKELLEKCASSEETAALKEQLRQKEEQLQATRQQASMLASELRDAAAARDRTMSELYQARLGADALRTSLSDAQAECQRMEKQLERMKGVFPQESSGVAEGGAELCGGVASAKEADLQREVEELKLRLHLAAEHYKEMCRECQRLRRQFSKHSEQLGDIKKTAGLDSSGAEGTELTRSESPESPSAGSLDTMDILLGSLVQERNRGVSKEAGDRSRRCKQTRSDERGRIRALSDELVKIEEKWKEQCKVNEELREQLAEQEQRHRDQVAKKECEVRELKESLALIMNEKESLEELQSSTTGQRSDTPGAPGPNRVQPMFLQYPLPYPQDPPPASLVQQRPAELQFGNPYISLPARDGAEGAFSPERVPRPSPTGPPSWESNVVCIQPSRNQSPPDGLERPEECGSAQGGDGEQPMTSNASTGLLRNNQTPFCFDSGLDIHKRCPLCEVIFPPHYEQSKFEEHVESHWKVCPMCSEQFPLDCDQSLFEKHVLTHFDGNVLNFD